MPDGTIHKQFSRASGWDAGLPRLSEVRTGTVRRKWTSVEYTQGNTSLLYAVNPRVTEVNVYDGSNRRRLTFDYTNGFNPPTHVREWGGATAQTLLRLKVTGYKQDADYINRRVIGLPYERQGRPTQTTNPDGSTKRFPSTTCARWKPTSPT